jgi:acetylornithine deacetylase
VCGPGDIAQAHQPNEFLLASQVTACEGFMQRMLEWAKRD